MWPKPKEALFGRGGTAPPSTPDNNNYHQKVKKAVAKTGSSIIPYCSDTLKVYFHNCIKDMIVTCNERIGTIKKQFFQLNYSRTPFKQANFSLYQIIFPNVSWPIIWTYKVPKEAVYYCEIIRGFCWSWTLRFISEERGIGGIGPVQGTSSWKCRQFLPAWLFPNLVSDYGKVHTMGHATHNTHWVDKFSSSFHQLRFCLKQLIDFSNTYSLQ